MRYLFSILLLLNASTIFSQEQTIHLAGQGKDLQIEKSKLIAPVFRLTSDTIESYDKFGVTTKKAPERFRVKLPDLTGAIDTGYTFLFNAVDPQNKRAYTTVIIANYSRRMKPAMLYTDRNNNLDFTDDGPADTFYFVLNALDITLHNPQNPAQQLTVKLSRFPFSGDESFKKLSDEFYTLHQGNKIFATTVLSFREQRMNVRTGSVVAGTDSFTIALVDANYNGLYNEPGIDKILLEKPGVEMLSHDQVFGIAAKEKDRYFERNFKSYHITGIDSFGRSLQFLRDDTRLASQVLQEGKKVPKIVFYDHEQKKVKLKWYRRKPVYIYFWNKENPTFAEDTLYLRKIQEKFCPMVKVIALNYGDNPKQLGIYVKYSQATWLNGTATKKITQQYYLEQVPYGFLLQKRLKLHSKGISPRQAWEILEKGEIW